MQHISLYCIQHWEVYSSFCSEGVCASRGYVKPHQELSGLYFIHVKRWWEKHGKLGKFLLYDASCVWNK